jgi:hypothetical protein
MAGWYEDWNTARTACKARLTQHWTIAGLGEPHELKNLLAFLDEDADMVRTLLQLQQWNAKLQTRGTSPADMAAAPARLAGYQNILEAQQKTYCAVIQKEMLRSGGNRNVMAELDTLRKKAIALNDTIKLRCQTLASAKAGLSGPEQMAQNMRLSTEAAVKRLREFLAQLKVHPENCGQIWNDKIRPATRDLTQNIGNVDKLRAQNIQIPRIPQQQLTSVFRTLEPYANDKVKFPINRPVKFAEIKGHFDILLKAAKDVEDWLKKAD